jgi:anti-sigma factor RsiW
MTQREDIAALRETMVAALYGELTEAELRGFRDRLAADPALQAEWDELQEARAFLRRAEDAEPVPEFVFLTPARVGSQSRPRAERAGWLRGLRVPTIGLALATATLLALMVGGLRVDREERGLALRWGPPPVPAPAGPGSAGIPLEPVASGSMPGVPSADSNGRTYLTRVELVAYSQELVRLMGSDLNDYDQRRSGETVYMVREAFDELARRQQQDYERLNARIDEIGRGLAALRETRVSGSPERDRNQ